MDATIEERLLQLEARLAKLEAPRRVPVGPAVVAKAETLEATLGTYWLSRIGILSLITGAALLIITYFAELGPFVRVAVGYAMAGVLAWTGLRLARTHEALGRIVFGGGLAIAYFVTYALHFVASLRVIESQVVGVVLVAVVIAAIVAIAHRMKSETVAGIALFLALHTGTLSEVTALSLIAATLLAAGAGFFLSFNRWVLVPLSTVVAVYTTHAVLAFGDTHVSPALRLAFVAIDFALFAAASLIGPSWVSKPLALINLLNWIGALVLGAAALDQVPPWMMAPVGAGFAVVLALLAALARVRRAPRDLIALQVALSIITLAIVAPLELEAALLVAAWLALAMLALLTARRSDPRFAVLSILLVLAAAQADGSIAAQLACVVAAIVVERWHAVDPALTRIRMIATVVVAYGLVTLAAALFPGTLHTLAYVAAAAVLFAIGFALRVRPYRWSAFVVLAAAAVRLVGVELRHFTANERILTFLGAGIALLVVSFVYSRKR